MKSFIYFMAIVALAAASEVVNPLASRSFSSSAEATILEIRDQMPCGFPKYDIPPLAPLVINHTQIDIDKPDYRLFGHVYDFNLNGLNDFDVVEMKINVFTKKVNMRLFFRNVNVNTLYDLKLYSKIAGFTINLIGEGSAKFAIKDMDISVVLKYSLGIVSQKLNLKSINVRVQIDDVESNIEGVLGDGVLNHKLNEILEEAVKTVVNENNEFISNTIESKVFPEVNQELNKYKLKDLIARIGKGNGNDTESVCKPLNE